MFRSKTWVCALAAVGVGLPGGRSPVVMADAAISASCHNVSGGELD